MSLLARRRPIGLALAVVALLVAGSLPPMASAGDAWKPDIERAADYAGGRDGSVSFAVVDESGRLRDYRAGRTSPSASVIKAMFMVVYLRQVRDRDLHERDKDLLRPMIRRSDNEAATRVRNIVGKRAIKRLAKDADMDRFRLHHTWGRSRINAREQARFFYQLERYVPRRHRRFARRMLESIVPSQRWGIAKVIPPGWTLFFKGGWGTGTGRVDHQVAFLERGERRISVAIFTEYNPSHAYGKRTLRGVAKRLLHDLR